MSSCTGVTCAGLLCQEIMWLVVLPLAGKQPAGGSTLTKQQIDGSSPLSGKQPAGGSTLTRKQVDGSSPLAGKQPAGVFHLIWMVDNRGSLLHSVLCTHGVVTLFFPHVDAVDNVCLNFIAKSIDILFLHCLQNLLLCVVL